MGNGPTSFLDLGPTNLRVGVVAALYSYRRIAAGKYFTSFFSKLHPFLDTITILYFGSREGCGNVQKASREEVFFVISYKKHLLPR
jgi:hypothetical protein